MRSSRAIFKQVLHQCIASESRAHADSLACKLLSRNSKQFWKEVQKLNGNDNVPLASTIGDATRQKNIAEIWKKHYSDLLNSTPSGTKK